MTRIGVDVLAREGNAAVIKLDDRKHPALVIQGDTFHALLELANDAQTAYNTSGPRAGGDALKLVLHELQKLHDFYEAALRGRGLKTPY